MGIDQYRLGNITEGSKLFTGALMNVQNFALSKQIAMILNKLNTSTALPEKKTEKLSAPVKSDERPPIVPPPTGNNINDQPAPQETESKKRPLEGEDQKPAKRPKPIFKISKPRPLPEAQISV